MGNRGARAEMEKVEESSERVGEKRVNGGARVYICVDTAERRREKRARSTLHKEDPLDQIKNVL